MVRKKHSSELREFVKAIIDYSKGKNIEGLKVTKICKNGKRFRIVDNLILWGVED